MPKASATRSAPVKRKTFRKSTATVNGRENVDGIPSIEDNISKYIEVTRNLVLAAWPEIVRGLIKKAANGGYQQTKLLLDVCNLTEQYAPSSDDQRQRQLCDALLEGLKLTPILQEMPNDPAKIDMEAGSRKVA